MTAAGRALGWIAAVTGGAACIAVIAHYNIAPSLDHADDSSARALIGVQVLCTILLALIQVDRGKHLSKWENASLSVLLIVFNVWAGMETTNRINDAANGTNMDKIAKAGQYKGQIADLKGQIEALGRFDPTSAKQVEAAQSAVKEASWQTRTCGRNCDMEAKTAALGTAQAHLDQLSALQTKTDDKARLEKDLQEAKDKLTGLGYVPEHANKTAALIASYLSCFGATVDGVEKWQPLVRSALIEILNRLAPGFVFLLILGLFSNVQAEAKADLPENVISASEDPTSAPSRRTTRKRTPKDRQDVSAKVIRFPQAEDARALIAEGKTQKEAAKLLGVTDRTIRRWLSSSKAAECPGEADAA